MLENTSRTLTLYDLRILAIQRYYKTLSWRPVAYDFMDTWTPQMSCEASGAYGPTADEMLPRLHGRVSIVKTLRDSERDSEGKYYIYITYMNIYIYMYIIRIIRYNII